MSPDDKRHGTEAGHEQHCRDDEDPCEPCYTAKLIAGRRRNKRKTMGYRYTVPADRALDRLREWRAIGASYGEIADHCGVEESRVWEILNGPHPVVYTRTANAILRTAGWPVTAASVTRRVRALARLGWTIPRIAKACGVDHDTILHIRRRERDFLSRKVREGVVRGYETLANQLPTGATQQERAGITRARNYAERAGWPSPWAFDDIDDLTAGSVAVSRDRDVDPVVVERIFAGDHTVQANRAEKAEVCRRWDVSGRSLGDLERMTGWNVARYYRKGDAA